MSETPASGSQSRRRTLPVVRWLQAGAVAAGVGVALVAAPGTAAADDTGADSSTSSASGSTAKPAASHATGRATTYRRGGSLHNTATPSPSTGSSAATRVLRNQASMGAPTAASSTISAPAKVATATTARSTGPTEASVISPSAAVAPTASAVHFDPFGQITAFFGLPGAPPTSAPSLGAISILTRLTVEDLVSGTGPAQVTNPTAVVTGLFNEVLRTNPTSDELQTYLGILNLTGVNGVVAGLYSSTLFRQTEVNNYYLQLLNRTATAQELAWNTSALMWGMPEPLFVASIVGSQSFYNASAAGGGALGPKPTSISYVDNLYRTLLGTPANPAAAAAYIQQLNAGLPLALAAWQFVTTETYRQAKVEQIYSVLDQTATQAQLDAAVQNWFWNGGLTGIATSLLATAANVSQIEANPDGFLPDMTAAAQFQQILLAAYTSNEDGFVKTLNQLLGNTDTSTCPSGPTCNTALYTLLTTGGQIRGLTNGAVTITYGTASVANLIPTQNEIDLAKSLKFTLQDPAAIKKDFDGGVITPFGDAPVITADDGAYIVDGHHRWSSIYLINPYVEVKSVDIGYVPNPQTALKETQVGVAAQLGYLKVATGGGINVYDVSQSEFNTSVNGWITTGTEKDAVLAVFRENLGILDTATEAEQLAAIDSYLWSNVLRMRALNPSIPNATNREVMPQAEPLTPILSLMGSGSLSYSFPAIPYLG
ncbi:hypothetical protein [Mycolicibacterium sarraceniae]|uniref:ParB-like nuclease n=1 Tax=Mycolicibacterium sarraceniae TaxID=1534348 RepID=A0A7I7SUE7_9MYCO|nr:hypothetical protein [Mycolicibacterium sarraceniae]BBY59685.1 hypothetical protein MSAR_28210 [Mycolicibacterium sarraceniae]